MRRAWVFFACLAGITGAARPTIAENTNSQLAAEVRALFAEKCFACHGPDSQEADLRLDTREEAIRVLDSQRQAIVPGDADASESIRRVATDNLDALPPALGLHTTRCAAASKCS